MYIVLGTAGDAMSRHQSMAFTTHDQDNDLWAQGNCAVKHAGGWWYNNCYDVNQNVLYYDAIDKPGDTSWLGGKATRSNRRTEMKLRPTSFVLDAVYLEKRNQQTFITISLCVIHAIPFSLKCHINGKSKS